MRNDPNLGYDIVCDNIKSYVTSLMPLNDASSLDREPDHQENCITSSNIPNLVAQISHVKSPHVTNYQIDQV